ncbi:MAG: hypothetical protein ACOX8R_06245 [Bacillota bacterium]|jgi:hypothetical protein
MKDQRAPFRRTVLFLTAAACFFAVLLFFCESRAVTVPKTERSIAALTEKEALSEEDYRLLLEETGLGRETVDLLRSRPGGDAALLSEQKRFHQRPDFDCRPLTGVTMMETVLRSEDALVFYDLRPGDVLLTFSTHTLFYRHGHCAIVLDDETIAEAVAIGRPVAVTKAAKWGFYPTVLQLRLSEEAAADAGMTPAKAGAAAAERAETEFLGDRYSLFAGGFGRGEETDETQCAHLIAACYAGIGVTASSRTFPATPMSLLKSGAFDIVQCRGVGPELLRR